MFLGKPGDGLYLPPRVWSDSHFKNTKGDVCIFAGQDGGIPMHTINQMIVPALGSSDACLGEDVIQCLNNCPIIALLLVLTIGLHDLLHWIPCPFNERPRDIF